MRRLFLLPVNKVFNLKCLTRRKNQLKAIDMHYLPLQFEIDKLRHSLSERIINAHIQLDTSFDGYPYFDATSFQEMYTDLEFDVMVMLLETIEQLEE